MITGEGERREAAQRKRFWQILGGLSLAGAVAGFTYALLDEGVIPDAAISQPVVIGAIALVVTIFLFGTWRFFRTIDEFELQDNLWGSTIAFYVYATVFPLWWALARLGQVGDPNDWAIFALSLASGALAYAWRKWRAR